MNLLLRSLGLLVVMSCATGTFSGPGMAVGAEKSTDGSAIYTDNFQEADHAGRRAQRGDWQFAEGTARCTQNDELYKQYKDHGPVIWYDVPLQGGVVRWSYRPEGCRTFVFTVNGANGHIFRFVSGAQNTNIRAWPTENNPEHKAVALEPNGPKLADGQWTDVSVEFRGAKATVKIGPDYTTTVEHPAIAQAKSVIGLGFSFGTLSVREFSISK